EECLDRLERALGRYGKKDREPYAGLVYEPLIQGAGGMIAQPDGWLAKATSIARSFAAPLLTDEVMTGFGRTGVGGGNKDSLRTPALSLFACQKVAVRPDYMALAEGLTGAYLPMAATLTTQKAFDAFMGEHSENKTFFHGHSLTGNQLGA